MTRRLLTLLAALVCACALAACSGSSSSSDPSELSGKDASSTFQGAALTPAQPRPAFTLTDTAGKSFPFATVTAKHPTLLYFGYTNCPDVCPTTMADIQQALAKLPATLAEQTYVVFVTTDVKTDTAARIKEWLSTFSDGSKATWVGVRGTQQQIDAAQAAAHVTVAEDGGKTHSAEAILYGPDDYAHVAFLQSDTLRQQVEHDLPLVAKGVS